ncbi:MAG TPA: hypothetical protein VFW90_02900 [Candidatus Saccharimonadales bacterium]|nr:hypothetical protein [Candidatus Saccharimonadales bacterium]
MRTKRTLAITAVTAVVVVALSASRAPANAPHQGPEAQVSGLTTTVRAGQALSAQHAFELRAAQAHSRTIHLRKRESALRRGIRFYRKATWRWQDLMLHPRTPTSHDERQLQSAGYLKWMAKLWKHRATRARHRVTRLMSDRGYLSPSEARRLGHLLAVKLYGWDGPEWVCLDTIWGTRKGVLESGWKVTADNPVSEAYGIPQANPGSKMAKFGANWLKSAWVQIKWGLWYVKNTYHTPCSALATRVAIGSY